MFLSSTSLKWTYSGEERGEGGSKYVVLLAAYDSNCKVQHDGVWYMYLLHVSPHRGTCTCMGSRQYRLSLGMRFVVTH